MSIIQQPLLRRQYRDLTQYFPDLLQRALYVRKAFDVLAKDPKNPAEDFTGFDVAKSLHQFFADRLAEVREFLYDFAIGRT
jgi:hypothetical protein